MQSYLPPPHKSFPIWERCQAFFRFKCTAILPHKSFPMCGRIYRKDEREETPSFSSFPVWGRIYKSFPTWEELKFLFTSECLALSLSTNPSSHGEGFKLSSPWMYGLGKESSFLSQSASFPSFAPKCNPNPSPKILSLLYVGKDASPLQKEKSPQILP